MSKTKTRKEINDELTALQTVIEQTQADHTAKVESLESTIANLTTEIDQAKTAITEADKLAESYRGEIMELSESLETVNADLTAEQESRAVTETGLAKAKAALQNPAFADASIIPHAVNQAQADAEADKAEADAEAAAEQPELDTLEQYESMPQGKDRQEFYKKHKAEIFHLMEERES